MSDKDNSVVMARSRLAVASKRNRPPEEAVQARRDLAEAKIARYVKDCLADAPPLSNEQLDRLSALLRPGAAA